LGIYFNPGNEGFRESTADPIYVDKSGIIPLLNPRIKSKRQKYLCVTRSRRFGKTCTAEMLAAYYSRGCDSRALFGNLAVSHDSSWVKHLNAYDSSASTQRSFKAGKRKYLESEGISNRYNRK